jgi:hypothetical protein
LPVTNKFKKSQTDGLQTASFHQLAYLAEKLPEVLVMNADQKPQTDELKSTATQVSAGWIAVGGFPCIQYVAINRAVVAFMSG